MGAWPRRFRAPGRVNLIGDHTDYEGGLALPMAVDLDTVVTHDPGPPPLAAVSRDGEQAALERFVDAAATTIGAHGGSAPGGVVDVTSDIPIGAGLASSAALSVALLGALSREGDGSPEPDRAAWADRAREVEERATGVASGLMDQLASIGGVAGHALFVDCATASVEPVPLPERLGIVVVDSGVRRALADSQYAERRAACRALATRLGHDRLRDASVAEMAHEPLAHHVVTENARVVSAVEALRAGAPVRLGELFLASHASLRDDFDVSTPELDLLVTLLVETGAHGARLMGAGFGGCVVAVTERPDAATIGSAAARRYRHETGRIPTVLVPDAAPGATVIPRTGPGA